jgi:1-acyl-sn-glycerol-3-phosphate acyltransferase
VSLKGAARFPARTVGFVGLTMSYLVAMETERGLASVDRKDVVLYDWMERYGRWLLKLYGVKAIARGPHVESGRYPGTDARGVGRIFVMNHRSLLDVFLTLAFVEATIVSRADLADWPVIGLAARRVKTLFVDRADKKSGAAVVQAMVGGLTSGRAVMVYAEGTTYEGDEVRPFRPGAFVAAERAGAEIVPVGLAYAGTDVAFLDETFPEHLKRVASLPEIRAALVFGEPIPAPITTPDDARAEAHARVQALVHEARKLL